LTSDAQRLDAGHPVRDVSTYFDAAMAKRTLKNSKHRKGQPPPSARSRGTDPKSSPEMNQQIPVEGETGSYAKHIGPPRNKDQMSRSSSEPVTWSETDKLSCRCSQGPLRAETIDRGAFKFEQGPYRSSSLDQVKGADSSVAATKGPPMSSLSRQAAYCGNKFGGGQNRSARQVSIPKVWTQQDSRHAHLKTNHSEQRKIIEPQIEAFSPVRSLTSNGCSRADFEPSEQCSDIWNPGQQSFKAPVSDNFEESEDHGQSNSAFTQLLHQCDRSRLRLQLMENSYKAIDQSRVDFLEDYRADDDIIFLTRTTRGRSRQELGIGECGSISQVYPRMDTTWGYMKGNSHEYVETQSSDEMSSQHMKYGHELGSYDDALDGEEAYQRMTVLQIPCVGGLDAETIFQDEAKDQGSRSHGGFWRPNRLY
jgi:hypothetical protein